MLALRAMDVAVRYGTNQSEPRVNNGVAGLALIFGNPRSHLPLFLLGCFVLRTRRIFECAVAQADRGICADIPLGNGLEALPQESDPTRFPGDRELNFARPLAPKIGKTDDKFVETKIFG